MNIKIYALYKYLGILLGVFFGFIQPTFFNKFFLQDDFAFIILVYGFATYLIFFDLGVSKPIYSILREKFIKNESINALVTDIMPFYNGIISILGIIFTFIIFIFYSHYPNTFNFFAILFLALAISLNIGLNYIENILNAVDEQIFFQKIDISRKTINILTLLLIFIDKTFILSMIINFLSLLLLYIISAKKIYTKYTNQTIFFPKSFNTFVNIIKPHYKKSIQYLIFTINETLIYNGGFILIPIFLSSFFVIQYSLWMKLFLGIALFIKVIIEIFIHKITDYYFNGFFYESRKYFLRALIISLITSLIFVVFLFFSNELLFEYWVSKEYKLNSLHFIALFIWLIGISIQSCSGTFMLAEGNQFTRMKNLSLIIMIMVICIMIISLLLNLGLDKTLFLSSILYLSGAFMYLKYAFTLFNKKSNL